MCQKDVIVPSLDPRRNRNKCGYVIFKKNIEEFKRCEILFPVGIFEHLNELQEDDWMIQDVKRTKAKWHKSCVLEISASK